MQACRRLASPIFRGMFVSMYTVLFKLDHLPRRDIVISTWGRHHQRNLIPHFKHNTMSVKYKSDSLMFLLLCYVVNPVFCFTSPSADNPTQPKLLLLLPDLSTNGPGCFFHTERTSRTRRTSKACRGHESHDQDLIVLQNGWQLFWAKISQTLYLEIVRKFLLSQKADQGILPWPEWSTALNK